MLLRTIALLPLSLALAGCLGNETTVKPTVRGDDFRTENKGIVLVSTSMNDMKCNSTAAKVARPDEQGRYASAETISLTNVFINKATVPSQIVLPAGRYAFVALYCHRPYANRTFVARVTDKRNIWDGTGEIYDKPIATFEVNAGEVVDIGYLDLGPPILGKKGFTAIARPTPEPMLAALAESHPDLHKSRLTRLMATPNVITSAQTQR
jgi:hypothetical protein